MASQFTTDDILNKLRKIQAMTQSPNENEAAVAASMMQNLLAEYNLSITDLAVDDPDPLAAYGKESIEFSRSNGTDWKRFLIIALARNNFCTAGIPSVGTKFNFETGRYERRQPTMSVVGKPVNVQAVRDMYKWLEFQLIVIAKVHIEHCVNGYTPAATWKDSFFRGAVDVIGRRLDQEKRAMREANTNMNALIVRTGTEIMQAQKQLMPLSGTYNGEPNRFSSSGYTAGQKAGADVGLRNGKSIEQPSPRGNLA